MLCYEQTDRSWLSRGLPVSKPWTKLLFSIDDQRALVTLQLSAFCGTAHHAVFAIKTSIKPFCCQCASLLFLGFFESLSINQKTLFNFMVATRV